MTSQWLLCQYWSTFAYAMKKQAWIQAAKTANAMRFHFDPKSWSAYPMYFVDSGRPLTGELPLLKTRPYGPR